MRGSSWVLGRSSYREGKQQHALERLCPASLLVPAGSLSMPPGGMASCTAGTAKRQAACGLLHFAAVIWIPCENPSCRAGTAAGSLQI